MHARNRLLQTAKQNAAVVVLQDLDAESVLRNVHKKGMEIDMKVRIKFNKKGAVRFIGHLDVMRFFQKAGRIVGWLSNK